MLPDDHEYWNDYPFVDSLLPTLLALKLPGVRRTWKRGARDGVRTVQRAPVVESFTLGNDLTVCLADLRSHRSGARFLREPDFRKLLAWARDRSCPGVLAIPQPLIVTKNDTERNLRSFRRQYAQLGCPGRVPPRRGRAQRRRALRPHRQRSHRLSRGAAGRDRLVAASNLTGLNGIATNVATAQPAEFPPAEAAVDLAWSPRPVDYFTDERSRGRFFVPSRRGRPLSAYPLRRTREHFMTVSLCRRPDGDGVELAAEAWLVRRRTGRAYLPARGLAEPFRIILR